MSVPRESSSSEELGLQKPSLDLVRSAGALGTMSVGSLPSAVPVLMEDGESAGPGKVPSISSVLRFKWTIIAVSVAVAVPATITAWLVQAPAYTARAEVRVRPIIPTLVFRTEDNGMIPLYNSFMNTQASIMYSPPVLQRVLEQQNVQQTEWYRKPPKTWLHQPPAPMERLKEVLTVRPRPGTEVIDVSFTSNSPQDTAVIVNAVLAHYIAYIAEKSDKTRDKLYRQLAEQFNTLQSEIISGEDILRNLKAKLGTGAPDELVARRRVRLDEMEARLDSTSGELSTLRLHEQELKKILRSTKISKEQTERLRYIRSVSGMSDSTKRHLRKQLESQHEALKAQVSESRQMLTELGEKLGTNDPNGQDAETRLRIDEAGERIRILNGQMATVQWRRRELAKLEALSKDKASATTQPWVRPEYNTDAEWRRLDVAAETARAKVEAMRTRLKDSHPTMVELVSELELAEKLLRARETQLGEQWQRAPETALAGRSPGDETQPVRQVNAQDPATARPNYEAELKSVELQLMLLTHQEKLLKKRIEGEREGFENTLLGAQDLEKETRRVNHKRQLFEAVRERLDQKTMERNVPGSIEVLAEAAVPSKPSQDRRVTFSIMALVAALGTGIGVAYLRANSKQAMYAAEDLPNPLRAPFLGQVPLIRKPKRAVLEEDPLVVESIRMVRTALFSRINGRCSTILISSADTGAGKSTVAAMLARSLAECGKRVLLVDADLRRRSLSERYGLADEPGFVESLIGSIPDDRVVFETDTPRLSVMPAGTPGDGTAIEATANGAFTACLDRLRPSYDIILLDACPILPVADARILSRQVDGTVLVVRQDTCRRNDVIDALAYLGSSGGKLLGTVFLGSAGRERYSRNYYYPQMPR